MASQNLETQRTNPDHQRLIIRNLIESDKTENGQDVIEGLSAMPKTLPPKYFYDQRGSQLFEEICQLLEYYPTRTETAIFKAYGSAIAHLTGPCEIAELGSGSATKTQILLDAYQSTGYPLHYLPIDVSETMLTESAQQLLIKYPTLSIHGLVSTYELALANLPAAQLPARMLCFIGSTLGNLQPHECAEFLAKVSHVLRPGDYFLLGLDLQKETSILETAYNDAQGVTAAFNLNMLQHLNRRFDGNFETDSFSHMAYYNSHKAQIEMHLQSLKAQSVHLKSLNFTAHFEQGERLLSEISRKFDLQETSQMLANHQLPVIKTFTDEQQWFGLLLSQRM